jgi:hypothetical protein
MRDEPAATVRLLLERPDLRDHMGKPAAGVFERRSKSEVHVESYIQLTGTIAGSRP